MFRKISLVATALAVVGTLATTVTPASAQRRHGGGHWHGHHRGYGGPAVLGGLAAGAIIGGALAARPYYRPAPYPYYEEPAYADGGYDADDAYCAQRFRSYDPGSGTYLGYDGLRHACP